MYEYEISRIRSAELIRQAENERLARAAVRARREARHAAENDPHSFRLRRLRSRTA